MYRYILESQEELNSEQHAKGADTARFPTTTDHTPTTNWENMVAIWVKENSLFLICSRHSFFGKPRLGQFTSARDCCLTLYYAAFMYVAQACLVTLSERLPPLEGCEE